MIDKKLEIIDDLYDVIVNGYSYDFDSFEYVYRVNDDEGWSSTSLLYFLQNEVVCQNEFEYINEELLDQLNNDLREMMQKKIGGKWNAFNLSFRNGEIKTNFDYEPQEL